MSPEFTLDESDFNQHHKQISVEVFQEIGKEIFKLRAEKDKAEEVVSEISERLENKKKELLAIMESAGLEKQNIAGLGTIYTQSKFTVTMPKDPEKKKEFFDYLKAKGIFEDMTTVHSQTLNSYYKGEMEAAIAEKNVDFKVPGLDEPKVIKTLNMRKG